MKERLDYLLSVELDDELEPAEREELDRLLTDHPEAASRRSSFASIDAALESLGRQPAMGGAMGETESRLDAGLASIQARIQEVSTAPEDELARRRRMPGWIPSIGLAAAAAMAVYFAVPSGPNLPTGSTPSSSSSSSSRPLADASSTDRSDFVDAPIALAVVFAVDEDSDTNKFIDSMSPDDFEIIEQLELLEFLAAREDEGHG